MVIPTSIVSEPATPQWFNRFQVRLNAVLAQLAGAIGPDAVLQGDASALTTTSGLTGGQPYPLAERFDDAVSVMEFIPETLRPAIRARTSTTDVSSYLSAALASGRDVIGTDGRYSIASGLKLQAGQRLLGFGCDSFTLNVLPSFAYTAAAVVDMNYNAGISGVGISYPDPLTYASQPLTRAQLGTNVMGVTDDRFRDVPAIRANYQLTELSQIRIENSDYGIRAISSGGSQQAGGSTWNDLKICGFKKGIECDSVLDFLKGGAWEFWPYGLSNNSASSFYFDGNTIGAELADIESLALTGIYLFGASLHMRASTVNPSAASFGTIGAVNLDGNCSRITMEAGRLNIAQVYSTKNSGQAGYGGKAAICFQSITQTGGELRIAQADMSANGGATDIYCHAGLLEIDGGTIEQLSPNTASVLVDGGTARIGALVRPAAGSTPATRSVEFVTVSGTGVADLGAMTFQPVRSGESGNAVVFNNDLPGAVVPRKVNGWGLSLAGGATYTQCSPTDAARITFTPTVTFATPNGFVPVYSSQQGEFWRTERGVGYNLHLKFNSNNSAAASGAFLITGMPSADTSVTGYRPQTLGTWSGIAFDSPYSQMTLSYASSSSALVMYETGNRSGGVSTSAQITAANVPNNTMVELYATGFLDVR